MKTVWPLLKSPLYFHLGFVHTYRTFYSVLVTLTFPSVITCFVIYIINGWSSIACWTVTSIYILFLFRFFMKWYYSLDCLTPCDWELIWITPPHNIAKYSILPRFIWTNKPHSIIHYPPLSYPTSPHLTHSIQLIPLNINLNCNLNLNRSGCVSVNWRRKLSPWNSEET